LKEAASPDDLRHIILEEFTCWFNGAGIAGPEAKFDKNSRG